MPDSHHSTPSDSLNHVLDREMAELHRILYPITRAELIEHLVSLLQESTGPVSEAQLQAYAAIARYEEEQR